MNGNGINQHLDIAVVDNAHDATQQGYFYREPVYTALDIHKVVVVKQGTESGRSTVDIILEDKDGKKYVTMLTGTLLRSIPTEFHRGDADQN